MHKKKYIYGSPRDCTICGVTFRPRDKGSEQKCCSNACRGKLQTLKAQKTCPVCGKVFVPTRADYESCSRKCAGILKKQRHVPDPMVEVRKKMASFCCSLIKRCLTNKTDRTRQLLGYTPDELKKHLEANFTEGMTWENYGMKKGQWSIDHTRPISSFPMETDIREINQLSNLMPMWHSENCSKKNKWEGR
jgi:hypothetical protein